MIPSQKTADIILQMLMSLFFMASKGTKINKKNQQKTKLAKIEELKIHIF